MALTLAPWLPQQFQNNNGTPAASHLLFVYEAGTSTKVTTYSDSLGASPNTNPLVLDASGRGVLFLSPNAYKFVLSPPGDTDPPTAPIWTRDNIQSTPAINIDLDVPGTAGEALTATNAVYLSNGSGGGTAGRWYKADSGQTYSSSLAPSIGMVPASIASGAAGSVRLSGRITGLAGLTEGAVYYIGTAGALTATPPANYRGIGVADSTTSLLVGQWLLPGWNSLSQDATATVPGRVSLSAQTLGDGPKHFLEVPTFDPGNSNPTSAAARTSGVIYGRVEPSGSAVGNSAGAETPLMSYTLPANVLDANDRFIRIFAQGGFGATASADKRLRLYWNGTSGTLMADSGATTSNNLRWTLSCTVGRDATSSQTSCSHMIVEGATLAAPDAAVRNAGLTVAETGTIEIVVTGAGTNAADTYQFMMTVEVL